ncbi:hypothetical protein OAV20_00665 [Euryarchaeota archaeon]|nr:hypothetical protein [Euryarchaeota archaeon]
MDSLGNPLISTGVSMYNQFPNNVLMTSTARYLNFLRDLEKITLRWIQVRPPNRKPWSLPESEMMYY